MDHKLNLLILLFLGSISFVCQRILAKHKAKPFLNVYRFNFLSIVAIFCCLGVAFFAIKGLFN